MLSVFLKSIFRRPTFRDLSATFIALLSFLFAAVFIVTACSGVSDSASPFERHEPEGAGVYGSALLRHRSLIEDGEPAFESVVEVIGGRTREGFLLDFDYMMSALEENYPHFGTIYRKTGVDLRKVATQVREMIADESFDIDSQIFYDILAEHFFPYASHVGHLGIVSPNTYHDAMELAISLSAQSGFNYRVMTHPASVEFYGPPIPREAIIPVYSIMGYESNFLFETIEEGSIAYVKFVTMSSRDFDADITLMTEFYERIQGFEHLIVDIRGNPGGQDLFNYLILSPNITETVSASMLGFYIDGELNQRFLQYFNFSLTPVDQVDVRQIPQMNEDDMRQMDYMVQLFLRADPNPDFLDLPPNGFDGQIWLLIDGSGFSAAEAAAYMSKQSGFATLVGEQSGGCIGGTEAIWVAMPNSGIIFSYDPVLITDEYGCSLNEFPTLPHHFNRQGMDALETALALISEQLTMKN